MPMCPYPFLRLIVGAGSVSLLLAGCLRQGSDETLDPAAGDDIGGGPVVVQAGADLLKPTSGDVHETPTQFSEAPALSDLVRLGTLPPVEARLPRNPGIIAPLQEIGRSVPPIIHGPPTGASAMFPNTSAPTIMYWAGVVPFFTNRSLSNDGSSRPTPPTADLIASAKTEYRTLTLSTHTSIPQGIQPNSMAQI